LEFAAQGGEKRRRYPWGKKFRARFAIFGLQPDMGAPKGVGRHPGGASLHGVEDMAGNVWEWVESKFMLDRGKPEAVVRGGVAYRTLRGGSWVNSRSALAATSRTGDLPGRRRPVYGFRCAADSP
jgi:iron(II)-dependent oxidoreductase